MASAINFTLVLCLFSVEFSLSPSLISTSDSLDLAITVIVAAAYSQLENKGDDSSKDGGFISMLFLVIDVYYGQSCKKKKERERERNACAASRNFEILGFAVVKFNYISCCCQSILFIVTYVFKVSSHSSHPQYSF
jgi:hypothetical protein